MLFNRFISQSNKFLCLGLSLLTASSITSSANKSQASPLNKHVDLIAQASNSPAPTSQTPVFVSWQNIVGGITGEDFGLTGGYADRVYARVDNLYATSVANGGIYQYNNGTWT